jgi:hypothetical protein
LERIPSFRDPDLHLKSKRKKEKKKNRREEEEKREEEEHDGGRKWESTVLFMTIW